MNLDANDFSFIINGAEVLSVEDDQINAAKRIDAAAGVNFGQTTLTYYEEDSHTFTLGGTNSSNGRYRRVGDMVHCWGYFTNVNITGYSGNVYIANLPFTVEVNNVAGNLMYNKINTVAGRIDLVLYANTSIDGFYIYRTKNNDTFAVVQYSDFSDDETDVYFHGCYITDQ